MNIVLILLMIYAFCITVGFIYTVFMGPCMCIYRFLHVVCIVFTSCIENICCKGRYYRRVCKMNLGSDLLPRCVEPYSQDHAVPSVWSLSDEWCNADPMDLVASLGVYCDKYSATHINQTINPNCSPIVPWDGMWTPKASASLSKQCVAVHTWCVSNCSSIVVVSGVFEDIHSHKSCMKGNEYGIISLFFLL